MSEKLKLTCFIVLALSELLTLSACTKTLTTAGSNVYELKANFVQASSIMGIYSYKSASPGAVGTPQFVTAVANSNSSNSVPIPEIVTRPAFVFGKPSNPLLYVNRMDPTQAVPLDLFLKVYSPTSSTPDFYFEIPIFTTQELPTSVTTALSWVLRWGYVLSDGVSPIYLSENQFDQLVGQVEVVCQSCLTKSVSQITQLILSNPSILSTMDGFVRSNSANAGVLNFNYNPPVFDFVYSPSTIQAGWNFTGLYSEPALLASATNMTLSLVLVSTAKSPQLNVAPDYWTHTAYLNKGSLGAQSMFPNITSSPLNYGFDNYSAGTHTFTGTFSVSPIAITMTATVTSLDQTRICLNSGTITGKTNRRLNTSLYYAISPLVVPGGAMPAGTLSTSKVAAFDAAAVQTGSYYQISFDTTGANPVYTISRTSFNTATVIYDPSTTTNIVTGNYYDGTEIKFDGLVVFIYGIPANGDSVTLYSPFNLTTSPAPGTNNVGCFDDSTNSSSALTYSLMSTTSCTAGGNYPVIGSDTSGVSLSTAGQLTWSPTVAQYNAAAAYNYTYKFCFIATDGATATGSQVSALIQLTQDNLPTIELDSNSSYFMPIFTGQSPRIPGQTSLAALPLTSTFYLEGQAVKQSFRVQDADGDPVLLTIQSISASSNCPLGGAQVVSDNIPFAQNFTVATQLSLTGSEVAPPSIYHYQWNYLPSYNQISNLVPTGGNLCVRFQLSYNTNSSTGGDPNLTSLPLGYYDVPVTITDVMNSPVINNSSTLSCVGSGCNQLTQIYSYPSLVQNTTTGGVTSNGSSEIVLSTGQVRTAAGIPVNAALIEGEYATINIPAAASLGTALGYSGTVSSANHQCDTLMSFDTTGILNGVANYMDITVTPSSTAGAQISFSTATTYNTGTNALIAPQVTSYTCPGAQPCVFTVQPLRYFTFTTNASNTGAGSISASSLKTPITWSFTGASQTSVASFSKPYDLINYAAAGANYFSLILDNSNYTGQIALEASTDNVNWKLITNADSMMVNNPSGNAISGNPTVSATITVAIPPIVSHSGTTEDVYYRIRGFLTGTALPTAGTCPGATALTGSMNLSAVINPVVYTLNTQSTSSCWYLQNTLILPQPSATNPDYLQIKLNTVDGVQFAIPYFSNESCIFTLTAQSPGSSALVTTFPIPYGLYTQDVDAGIKPTNTSNLNSFVSSFFNISTLLGATKNFTNNFPAADNLFLNNSTATNAAPVELNGAYDLFPFSKTNFLHSDNGLYNGFYSVTDMTSTAKYGAKNGSELFFEVSRWNKSISSLNSYYMPVVVSITGTFTGSFAFYTSPDNATWTAASVKLFDPISGTASTPGSLTGKGTYLVYATSAFRYLKATSTLTASSTFTATVVSLRESDQSASSNVSMQVFPRSGSTVVYAYTAPTGTTTLFDIDMGKVYSLYQIPTELTFYDSAATKGLSTVTPQFWDGSTMSGGAPVWKSYAPIALANSTENIYLQVPATAAYFRTVSNPATSSQTLNFTISGSFNTAVVQFQTSPDGINWTNLGSTFGLANSSATPPSLTLTYTQSVPLFYRAKVNSITSGTLNLVTTGLGNNFTDSFTAATTGNLHQPVFHTITSKILSASGGVDPRLAITWYCWVIDPAATPPYNDANYTACNAALMGGTTVDQDGNSYFNPVLPSNLDSGGSAAYVGFPINAAGNGTKIKLRAVGKGYYPTTTLSPSATCGSGTFGDSSSLANPGVFTAYDCSDLSFIVGDNDTTAINTVTEVAAQPIIKVYAGNYSNVNQPIPALTPNGYYNPYNNNTVNPTGNLTTSTYEVEAGNGSTYTAIVIPYSNRPADQDINFRIAQSQCIKVGYGNCSEDAIFKARTAAALISDPTSNPQAPEINSGGGTVQMCSSALMSTSTPASGNGPSSTSFYGCGYQTGGGDLPVSGFFNFQISTDPTDINNVNNISNAYQLYNVTFGITHSSNKSSPISSDTNSESFQVNVNVKNPNY